MTDLPRGWEWATVGDITVDVRPGFASGKHNRDGDGVLHLRPMNVTRHGTIDLSNARFVSDDTDRRVMADDVLFNNTNSPELVGKTALVRLAKPAAYSNHMTRLQAAPGIEPGYLAHYLHWLWQVGHFKSIMSNHVNQASVATRPLLQVNIAIPSTSEQQRIVAALDEHLSRIDAGLEQLEQVGYDGTAFERAILDEAVGQPEAEWRRVAVGDIANVTSGATPNRSRRDYYDGGQIPWVTSSLLNSRLIDRVNQFITEKAMKETSVHLLDPGTILVAMYGEGKTRGKCSELAIRATTNQACAAISVRDEFAKYQPWVKLTFEANYERNRRLSAGGVQPNLSLSIIKSMQLHLPPIPQMESILDAVGRHRHALSRMVNSVDKAKRLANVLRRSLLAEAFAGRLVPQDPRDEPASVLLERIRRERDGRPKPKRARKPSGHENQETLL